MAAESPSRDKRVLRIAIIAFAIIEALALIPLILHLADK